MPVVRSTGGSRHWGSITAGTRVLKTGTVSQSKSSSVTQDTQFSSRGTSRTRGSSTVVARTHVLLTDSVVERKTGIVASDADLGIGARALGELSRDSVRAGTRIQIALVGITVEVVSGVTSAADVAARNGTVFQVGRGTVVAGTVVLDAEEVGERKSSIVTEVAFRYTVLRALNTRHWGTIDT